MAEGAGFAVAGKGIVQHGLVVLIDFPADVAHDNPPCLAQDGSRLHHVYGFRPVFVKSEYSTRKKTPPTKGGGVLEIS